MRLLDALYANQRAIWRTLKPRTRGVKVMLFDAHGRLLLMRNSYGDTRLWVLPGGGVNLFESTEGAARREVREELSCAIRDLTFVATHYSEREGKRDSVWLYEAVTDEPITPDPKEVAEAAFFALDQLPDAVSPATARRIAERQGQRERSDAW